MSSTQGAFRTLFYVQQLYPCIPLRYWTLSNTINGYSHEMVKCAPTDPRGRAWQLSFMVHKANSIQNMLSPLEMLPLILLSYVCECRQLHCMGKHWICAQEGLDAAARLLAFPGTELWQCLQIQGSLGNLWPSLLLITELLKYLHVFQPKCVGAFQGCPLSGMMLISLNSSTHVSTFCTRGRDKRGVCKGWATHAAVPVTFVIRPACELRKVY